MFQTWHVTKSNFRMKITKRPKIQEKCVQVRKKKAVQFKYNNLVKRLDVQLDFSLRRKYR